MDYANRLLKAAELFEKKAQRVTYKGETLRGMLGKLLTNKGTQSLRNSPPGTYGLFVDYHLIPDKSKLKYDKMASSAKVLAKDDFSGEVEEVATAKLAMYNQLAKAALIRYYEGSQLPRPLPDGHPGRAELKRVVEFAKVTKGSAQ